jgi:MacB-like periplasmic core domain
MESEMDAELHFHIEAYAEDLVRSGFPHDEAMRRARIEFGGIERAKEECRESRGVNLFDSVVQDVRFALRMLCKSPGLTAVAVSTLALGIGANATIFSFVNALLLHIPAGIAAPNRLVTVWNRMPDGQEMQFSYPEYLDFRDHNDVFSNFTAYSSDPNAGELDAIGPQQPGRDSSPFSQLLRDSWQQSDHRPRLSAHRGCDRKCGSGRCGQLQVLAGTPRFGPRDPGPQRCPKRGLILVQLGSSFDGDPLVGLRHQ